MAFWFLLLILLNIYRIFYAEARSGAYSIFYAEGRSGAYSISPWCYVCTCECAYLMFVTRFKFTCKFRCNFTSVFLLQLITFIPFGLESWNLVWYLPREALSMHGTIAPGSCSWAGLGVKIHNRSSRKHTKMWLKISLWYHWWGWRVKI